MLLAQQGFQSLKRDNCLSNVFMNHVSAGKSHAFQSLKRDNCLSNTRSTSRILATRAGFNRSSATIASPTRSHPSRSYHSRYVSIAQARQLPLQLSVPSVKSYDLTGFNRSSATIASPTLELSRLSVQIMEFQSLKRDNCLSNATIPM